MAKTQKRSADPITQRLKTVIEKHSLNEVARRTKTAPACVHRYVNGSKIPADFCGRIVQEFQINPSWLLNGEGASDLSGIAAKHSDMAGELLDMVQAMNAVAHMRMGALAGKHHEKVLRELNDALGRYEELRGRIGKHAKPIYEDLAGQLEKVMGKLDLDTADDLMKAADQVERLCFDDELSIRHLALKARISLLRKQFDKACEYQRRLFRIPISNAALDNDEFCTNAMRLAITLENAGDVPRAMKILRAAMLLCEGHEDELKDYPMLVAQAGKAFVETGKLFHGLQLMQKWISKVGNETRRESLRHNLRRAMMLAGSLAPEDAFGWGEHSQIKAFDMLHIAMVVCQQELLQKAVDYYNSDKTPKHKVYEHREYTILFAEAVLLKMKGENQEAVEKHKLATASASTVAKHVLDALYHRVSEDGKKLKASVKKSIKALTDSVPTPMPLVMTAIHHKNVLASGVKNPPTDEFINNYSEYILFGLDH